MPKENSGRLADKANKLYWQTSRPAGHLADELGISRSKFYALIEPLRLQESCEACGTSLAFASRTDREARRGRCPECGAVAEVPPERVPRAPSAAHERPEPPSDEGLPGAAARTLAAPENRDLWLTAACGLAVGLLVTAWFRRR